MNEIARVIPAVPVSLVATAFLRHPARAWSELEVKGAALDLVRELESAGAHVYVPRGDQDYAITVGLRMLTLRHLVTVSDGLYSAVPAELPPAGLLRQLDHPPPGGSAVRRSLTSLLRCAQRLAHASGFGPSSTLGSSESRQGAEDSRR